MASISAGHLLQHKTDFIAAEKQRQNNLVLYR